jgi:hypothetical protein
MIVKWVTAADMSMRVVNGQNYRILRSSMQGVMFSLEYVHTVLHAIFSGSETILQ